MYVKQGDFIYLEDDTILEIVYADEHKAVGLRISECEDGILCFTGTAHVFSNKENDYKDKRYLKIGHAPENRKAIFRWRPIKIEVKYEFN